ncbi:hypothetical protein TanjilG_15181 [Lupinus angustifolius]|uniref:Nuclease associated modular domain-containing protein n=2 Tax=Lupinus angustifolius TaxID=3871 RepID=A0A1J7H6K1_LUPAN|nr:hypothetical protein TanjilG_15181 [Lupinus angustifolius]
MVKKTETFKLTFVCSSQRVVLPFQGLQISVDDGEVSHVQEYNQSKLSVDSSEEIYLNNENEVVVGLRDSLKSLSEEVLKERIRRMRIGLANKGKVPWNKGRKHTAETRERIRQRTLEALRSPKVRKKMAEHPRAHSDQIKAKISYSQRRVWQERLKSKRLGEKWVCSWEQNIANAARKGESGQEELDWDSYDKIKQQFELRKLLQAEKKGKEVAGAKKFTEAWEESIAKAAKKGGGSEQELNWDSYEKIQKEMFLDYQLQRTAQKAKAKEMVKANAKKVAQKKAIKKVILTQIKKGRQDRTKARGVIKSQPCRKVKEGKGDLQVGQEVKLQPKLTKILISKTVNSQTAREGDIFSSILSRYKKLDLELIKREKMQKEVSLADQIQAARDKKAKFTDQDSAAYSDN